MLLPETGEAGLEEAAPTCGRRRVVDQMRIVAAGLRPGGLKLRIALKLRHLVGGDQQPVEEAPVRRRIGAAVGGRRRRRARAVG